MLELTGFMPHAVGSVVMLHVLMDAVSVGLWPLYGNSMPFSKVSAGRGVSGASAIGALALR